MSLLRSRGSPLWVIEPRSVLSPVESLGGNQPQKGRQLANVFNLAPVADTGHHLARHDPADPRKRLEIVYTLRQFRVVLAKAADLAGRLKNLFLVKLQTVQQLVELKAHHRGAGKLSQLGFDQKRPLAAGRSRGKLQPFHQQQRFNPLLHPHHLADQGVAQLGQVAQLPVQGRGNMDALELPATQILRDPYGCRADWSSLVVLALWESSMARRSHIDNLEPPSPSYKP